MRIALLTDGIYPYVVGGMQKHSCNLARYYARQKVQVDLYHSFTPGSKYDIEKLEVFSEEEKKYIRSVVISFPSQGYYPGHYLRESFLYSAAVYEQLMKSPLPDYIYAQGFTAWKSIKEKQKGAKLPVIGVNFHGLEMFQQTASLKAKLQQVLLRNATRYNLLHADQVINYGGKIADLLLQIGCKPAQLVTSPNATEEAWLEEKGTVLHQPRKFLFIGRFERRKGVQELTQVLKKLLAENILDFEFHFVGPIPDHEKISSPKVLYHGSVIEFDAVKKIMREADILVCPSLAEGMPTVILEAMASGLAIIGTDTGGTRSWVSESTGKLVEPGSVPQLYEAMQEALQWNPDVLQQKKENAIALVKKDYLWERVIEKSIEDIKRTLV